MKTLVLIILACIIACPSYAEIIGTANVVDGDTIKLDSSVTRGDVVNLQLVTIRLLGIDAPEAAQQCELNGLKSFCGIEAGEALKRKIGKNKIRCEGHRRDVYGRLLAICFLGAENINAWLIAQGWAVRFMDAGQQYKHEEQVARSQRKGIWSGDFETPADYRKRQKLIHRKPACYIKGNISRNGKMLYHLPGTEWYDATRINPARGERFFCTEDEARAAGWRKSK